MGLTPSDIVSTHHHWILEEVLESGMQIEELAAETGLEPWRIASFLDGGQPSDIYSMVKLMALLCRRRAEHGFSIALKLGGQGVGIIVHKTRRLMENL